MKSKRLVIELLKISLNLTLAFIVFFCGSQRHLSAGESVGGNSIFSNEIGSKIRGSETGRPLPRYVSLKRAKVHMRRGPGKEFKIDWIYYRKNLPVKIILEYLRWRKVEDFEGYTGWVHASLLSGKKSMIVTGDDIPLKNSPYDDAQTVAYLKKYVLVSPKECNKDWCKVETNGFEGWIDKKLIWGGVGIN